VGFSSLGPQVSIAAPAGNCGTAGGCAFSIDTTTNLGTLSTTQTCPTAQDANAKCHTTPGANDYTDQNNANLGTSFSAPIVSGTIALMLGADPTLSPDDILAHLQANATAFPQTAVDTNNQPISCVNPNGSAIPLATNQAECNCSTSLCGAGMVNALKSVQSVSSISSSSSSSVTSSSSSVAMVSGATRGGGGSIDMNWLTSLAALLLLRAKLMQPIRKRARRYL
jgi:serine protease